MVCDGAAFSVMVGVGENYLPAFALALGMGEVVAGLIASLPLLAGALLQLITPAGIQRLGSNRRWVVLCATIQAVAFLPLLCGALAGHIPVPLLFLMAAVYWAAGMAAGPAWNVWAATIVPPGIRARYFGRRSRLTQAGTLTGFVGGGAALQLGDAWQRPLWAFATLFLIAAIARGLSAAFLARQSEPSFPSADHRVLWGRPLLRRCRGTDEGRLLVYLVAVQASAQVASPFFTPYMLGQLRFSYATYVTIIATSLVTKAIALPLIGALAHRWGAHRLLCIGGLATIPLPALWLLSDNPTHLIGIQVLAGASWATYELASFLLLFEALPPADRTSLLTTYNLAHAAATVVGSMLGGLVLAACGESQAGYLAVFGISAVARFATLPLMRRVPATVVTSARLYTRSLAVRPSAGTVDQPVLASLGEAQSDCDRRAA